MAINDDIISHFSKVNRVEIDKNKVLGFEAEGDFVGVCVDLLIEAGGFLITAASIYPSGHEGWTRDQAIIGGSLVRLYKLIDAILDQTCRHRLETSFILSRLHFETTVNAVFLMQNPSPKNFNNFVAYSLQHESKLLDKIETNVSERGGEELPTEKRMKRSINRMFALSQMEKNSLPSKFMRDWQDSNLFKRAQSTGFETIYNGIFSGGSQIVHGNWGDLFQHHLEPKGDRFIAKTTFKEPRPQFLEVIAILSATAVTEYVKFLGFYQERQVLTNIFEEFIVRVQLLSSLHEDFLNAN